MVMAHFFLFWKERSYPGFIYDRSLSLHDKNTIIPYQKYIVLVQKRYHWHPDSFRRFLTLRNSNLSVLIPQHQCRYWWCKKIPCIVCPLDNIFDMSSHLVFWCIWLDHYQDNLCCCRSKYLDEIILKHLDSNKYSWCPWPQ